jgi:hypothetical protein
MARVYLQLTEPLLAFALVLRDLSGLNIHQVFAPSSCDRPGDAKAENIGVVVGPFLPHRPFTPESLLIFVEGHAAEVHGRGYICPDMKTHCV